MQFAHQVTHPDEPVIIARSAQMRRVLDLAARAAQSEATVLIQGETGTGKELVARTIHCKSKRRTGPFVAVNCGAYSDSLLASELFGHQRGAFTGAIADRVGVFEAAAGGTVFLDEIGATSPAMQVKLLRVLQERRVTRVGSSLERAVDTRVVAATNADLAELVRDKTFREDLYYRVKVVSSRIPPLRERPDDIKPLIDHYLEHFANANAKTDIHLSPEAERVLINHRWPGNVRQLCGEIEQIVAMAPSGTIIKPRELSEDLDERPPGGDPGAAETPLPNASSSAVTSTNDTEATYQQLLDEWTRDVVARRLDHFAGNITKTAQSLAISRSTLYALLRKYGMRGQED